VSTQTAQAHDAVAFRAQFPVLERLVYLNAGTEGPVPRSAAAAVQARVEAEASEGRCGRRYHDGVLDMATRLRAGYARVLGCAPSDVALTGSTTDGVNTVLSALSWSPGDEILTSDEEHPGLLAPLGLARKRHGVEVRVVPFAQIAESVRPRTRLIACSHVSWVNGQVLDTAAIRGTGVPLLLDGAQGVGAVPVDVTELGCDFYAGSGQKWLCGPEGSGCLYVSSERLDDLLIPWPGYGSLADALRALELEPADGAARFDHGYPVGVRSAHALAALEVFESAGWPWVHQRAATLAELLAQRLLDGGFDVLPRGHSTLVSFGVQDAQATVERLAAEGVIVRSIPTHGVVRASVGAWSSEEDIERLMGLLS
jgi:selenocysteine lyase/cysteine desulfurase